MYNTTINNNRRKTQGCVHTGFQGLRTMLRTMLLMTMIPPFSVLLEKPQIQFFGQIRAQYAFSPLPISLVIDNMQTDNPARQKHRVRTLIKMQPEKQTLITATY